MFVKVPAKHRRNLVVEFRNVKTSGGDQDIKTSITDNLDKLKKLDRDNQRLRDMLKMKEKQFEITSAELLLSKKREQTLQNLGKETKSSIEMDRQFAFLQTELGRLTKELSTIQHERKQAAQVIADLSNKLSIAESERAQKEPEIQKDNEILQLTARLNQVLASESKMSNYAAQLTEQLQLQKQALADCSMDKERYVEMNKGEKDYLANLVSMCKNDVDTCRQKNQSQLQTALQDLANAQARLAAFESNCREDIARLVEENRQLEAFKKQTLLDMQNLIPVVEQQDQITAAVCNNYKNEIANMIQYIDRQVAIFALAFQKDSKVLEWQKFSLENKELYLAGDTLVKTFSTNIGCDSVITFHTKTIQVFTEMRKLETVLTNLFEDLAGAVRVYVRIKPLPTSLSKSTVAKKGKSVTFMGSECGLPVTEFGRFFGVIPQQFTNEQMYTGCEQPSETSQCCITNDASGLCRAVNQLKTGYNIVVFGYGSSGSGKTTTLLGDAANDSSGLVQLAMINSGASKIILRSVFELAYDKIDFRSKDFNSGKFIELFSRGERMLKSIPESMIKQETQVATLFAKFRKEDISSNDLLTLRLELDRYRTTNGRIKATPNNQTSSRSHLFLTLEFYFEETAQKGLMTVVDMGGREGSIEILDMFMEKPVEKPWQLTSMMLNPKLMPSYIKPHVFKPTDASLSWRYDKNKYGNDIVFTREMDRYVSMLNQTANSVPRMIDLIKESVFINETVSQLTLFFLNKTSAQDVHMDTLHLPLDDVRNPYDPKKLLTGKPTLNEKMGMYRILNALSTSEKKPTKFIMICCVRQETFPLQLCKLTRDTLEFAQSIRST